MPSWGKRSELTVLVLFNIICHITGESILYSKYQKLPKQMMQLRSLIKMCFCINAVSSTAFSPAYGFLCMLGGMTPESLLFFALLLPVTGEASGHAPSAATLQFGSKLKHETPQHSLLSSKLGECSPALPELHTKDLICEYLWGFLCNNS